MSKLVATIEVKGLITRGQISGCPGAVDGGKRGQDRHHANGRQRTIRKFRHGRERTGYEILDEVVFNQVLVSFGREETTTTDHQRNPDRWNLLVWRDRLERT